MFRGDQFHINSESFTRFMIYHLPRPLTHLTTRRVTPTRACSGILLIFEIICDRGSFFIYFLLYSLNGCQITQSYGFFKLHRTRAHTHVYIYQRFLVLFFSREK